MGLLNRLFGKPSIADFAQQMIQAFRASGDKSDLRFDASENRIVRGESDDQWTVNLANMYQMYLQRPRSERAEYVRTVARGLTSARKALPKEFDLARADLKPRLWLRSAFEQIRLNGLIEGGPVAPKVPPYESVGEHLIVTLVYDWPEAVQVLRDEDLTEWNVTFYEAMEVARENLDESTVSCTKIADGFYSFISGDTYDACRITLLDRIRDLEVSGKQVAMAPNREALFVTGSEDEAGLATMAAMAEKHLQEPYWLSAIPLILEDGEWRDWILPEGHPLHRAFKQMEIKWLGGLYADQTKLLNAVHEKQGIDVSVASYSALKKKDGDLLSYCVWGNGADSLLPVTQKVVFTKGENIPPVFADWSRVIETFGDLMEETGDYPRRYRVREFPEENVIDAIGSTELG
jgi:hypothetical protein